MEQWQKNLIFEHLPHLMQVTDVSRTLLDQLKQFNILSNADVQFIDSEQCKQIQAYRLYKILTLKIDGFQYLLDALNSESNRFALQILSRALCKANEYHSCQENTERRRDRQLVEALYDALKDKPQVLSAFTNALSSTGDIKETKEKHILINVLLKEDSGLTVTNSTLIPAAQINYPNQFQRRSSGSSTQQEEVGTVTFSRLDPLKICLKRPTTPVMLDKDCYQIPSRNKGLALVVNIIDYDGNIKSRNTAKPDTTYMRDLWTEVGYGVDVEERDRITKDDLSNILIKFKEKVDIQKPASSIIFIGSHGIDGHIMTSEGEYRNVFDDIVYELKPEVCDALRGKPKIFLISACQIFLKSKEAPDQTTTDDALSPAKSLEISGKSSHTDDMIVVYATSPGHYAFKDKKLGTWFSYSIAKVIMRNAHNTHFEDMVNTTKKEMRKIKPPTRFDYGQICSYIAPGIFKKLFFNLETASSCQAGPSNLS